MTASDTNKTFAERIAQERPHRERSVRSNPRFRTESAVDREIARKGHLVHRVNAKDSTGRWAVFFVLVEEQRTHAFTQALSGGGSVDLEDFGQVIASCYGEEPNDETRQLLRDRFGFEV